MFTQSVATLDTLFSLQISEVDTVSFNFVREASSKKAIKVRSGKRKGEYKM
jgi:hypothetical protein